MIGISSREHKLMAAEGENFSIKKKEKKVQDRKSGPFDRASATSKVTALP
jgi:hypothetical protein